MRPIHLVRLDKVRPALILTREQVRPARSLVTIAPITTTMRGLSTELVVGPQNGLDHDSVVSLDNITTVPVADVGRQIGRLLFEQEVMLTEAITAAFDLD